MQNKIVPIEMCNVNKHRQRTNNGVAGWNSKRHGIVGKQQPNVFSASTEIETGSRVGIM
jgi:hypothetical protein